MRLNVSRVLRAMAISAALLAGVATTAQASPIVNIAPSTQNRNVGDVFSVDILVSDLTEAVGGFELNLAFDQSILGGLSYTIGSAFGTGFDGSFGFTGGAGSPLNLYFASFESIADLTSAQGTAFSLATISFQALAAGESLLQLSGVALSNGDGTALLDMTTADGRVCVGGACDVTPVPEPATISLLGTGFLLSALARRRSRKNRS